MGSCESNRWNVEVPTCPSKTGSTIAGDASQVPSFEGQKPKTSGWAFVVMKHARRRAATPSRAETSRKPSILLPARWRPKYLRRDVVTAAGSINPQRSTQERWTQSRIWSMDFQKEERCDPIPLSYDRFVSLWWSGRSRTLSERATERTFAVGSCGARWSSLPTPRPACSNGGCVPADLSDIPAQPAFCPCLRAA